LLSYVLKFPEIIELTTFNLIIFTGSFLFLLLSIYIVIQLIRKAIIGINKRIYDTAKKWILIGMLFGLVVGIIPFIIFLISYVSFDDALKNSDDYRQFLTKKRRTAYKM
jgi:hypothetical protein